MWASPVACSNGTHLGKTTMLYCPRLDRMLRREEDGTTSVLMECPHCENYGWHQQARPDDDKHFQCAQCFAGFTYSP